jgi:hypothetical protein
MEYELEYLGVKDDCRELTVWTGDICRPACIRATEVNSGSSISLQLDELQDTFSAPENPGAFLYEPVRVLIRSHLFGYLAQQLNLWQIDSRTAYLSGSNPVKSPFLKSFKVLECLPYNFKTIRKALKKYDIGLLDIKKRGLNLIPEKARRELNPRGSQPGVIIFTRVKNVKTAFLVEPVR